MRTIHTAIRFFQHYFSGCSFRILFTKGCTAYWNQVWPINKAYELPDVSGEIYYVAPDGKAGADGKNKNQPASIETAISKAVTGDAIIMRGGFTVPGTSPLIRE